MVIRQPSNHCAGGGNPPKPAPPALRAREIAPQPMFKKGGRQYHRAIWETRYPGFGAGVGSQAEEEGTVGRSGQEAAVEQPGKAGSSALGMYLDDWESQRREVARFGKEAKVGARRRITRGERKPGA
ncbi:hypothetical protein HPP92_028993, partial [Vanilla planifolia]